MAKRAFHNPVVQALLLGLLLFTVSFAIRVLSNLIVGGFTAGPAPLEPIAEGQSVWRWVLDTVLLSVALPALIETPFVVFPVRRADQERPSVALWIMVAVIAGFAWLFHGASPGALGQAAAFALMAYAAWGWSRRCGRWSYGLAILAHAVWNGSGLALYLPQRLPGLLG